jgi:hypothetical protein
MPIEVYLDSSDYSRLSDPNGVSDQLVAIKEKLLAWSRSGEVIFRFSAAHIVEMAPTEVKAEPAAEARTNFLSDLCGTNCLISFDQLMSGELGRYATDDGRKFEVSSNEGNWFPHFEEGIFSVLDEDRLSPTNLMPKFEGLPRDARRKAEREIFKNGKLRPEAKRQILTDADNAIQSILRQFPMRKRDAEVLVRYMIGDATKAAADQAFYASLRDPKWMMQWFRRQRDPMLPIIEWLRQPAKNLHVAMAATSTATKQLRQGYKANGQGNEVPPELTSQSRIEMLHRWLQSISASVLTDRAMVVPEYNFERLQALAPGFVTSIAVSTDTMWASASEAPRESMPSDFVDAVHSMYAAYVDVYRTDAFMAPLVSKRVKSRGTTVVGKITGLVDAIESRLKAVP